MTKDEKVRDYGTSGYTLSFAGGAVISKYTHCLVQKHACTASIRRDLHALVLGTSRATGVSLVLHAFRRLELMPFTQQSEQSTDVIYSMVVCTMIRLDMSHSMVITSSVQHFTVTVIEDDALFSYTA